MRKLTEAQEEDGASEEITKCQDKIKQLKKQLQEKNDDLKANITNCLKLCEYILSRAVYPDGFTKRNPNTPKIKLAIEGVTYMARTITKIQKENYQLKNSLRNQEAPQAP